LLPDRLIMALQRIEPVFNPLSAMLAFRMMVVLEKDAPAAGEPPAARRNIGH